MPYQTHRGSGRSCQPDDPDRAGLPPQSRLMARTARVVVTSAIWQDRRRPPMGPGPAALFGHRPPRRLALYESGSIGLRASRCHHTHAARQTPHSRPGSARTSRHLAQVHARSNTPHPLSIHKHDHQLLGDVSMKACARPHACQPRDVEAVSPSSTSPRLLSSPRTNSSTTGHRRSAHAAERYESDVVGQARTLVDHAAKSPPADVELIAELREVETDKRHRPGAHRDCSICSADPDDRGVRCGGTRSRRHVPGDRRCVRRRADRRPPTADDRVQRNLPCAASANRACPSRSAPNVASCNTRAGGQPSSPSPRERMAGALRAARWCLSRCARGRHGTEPADRPPCHRAHRRTCVDAAHRRHDGNQPPKSVAIAPDSTRLDR